MTQRKNKNTFLMVVVMALPVILGAMYIISVNMRRHDVMVSEESLIIPDIDDVDILVDDKAKIYRDEQNELLYQRNTEARNIASDKDFFAIDSDFGKDDRAVEQQVVDRETQQVLNQYGAPEQRSGGRGQATSRLQSPPEAPPASRTNTPVEQAGQAVVTERASRSSMEVYTAHGIARGCVSDAKMDKRKKYLQAVLEEDKVIQHGSNVIFVLSEDGLIDGTNHKRGSILYGRATQGKEFFEINIYQVRSANDGHIYPAGLVVFDENYNRGIRSEGFLNEAGREEGIGAATQTIDDATRGASSVHALEVAARAITRTATRTARSKPVTITLKKGYKVYLQSNQ